jgi:hypothetical protein
MEPIRTDFKNYEGKFVALDWKTWQIVIATDDFESLLKEAKGRKGVVVYGLVPGADEPLREYWEFAA